MATISEPTVGVFESDPTHELDLERPQVSFEKAVEVIRGSERRKRGRPQNPQKVKPAPRRLLKPKYQFVPEEDKDSDVPIRTLIRAHVMQDFHRKLKNGIQPSGAANRVTNAMTELERRNFSLPKEKWDLDPFCAFPRKLGPVTHDQLSWYFLTIGAKLYPCEHLWKPNTARDFWLPKLLTNTALLNSTLFSVATVIETCNGPADKLLVDRYISKTAKETQVKLRGDISDSTIAAVCGLAIGEKVCGNHLGWETHMKGLKKIIDFKGGLSVLNDSPLILDEVRRADLLGSVDALSVPHFEPPLRFHLVLPPNSHCRLRKGFRDIHTLVQLNKEFLNIIQDFDATNGVFELVTKENVVDPVLFRENARSLQYRLLNFHTTPDDYITEACRIGLLLWIGISLHEFWHGSLCLQICKKLRETLQNMTANGHPNDMCCLWLCFLASIALRGTVMGVPEREWFARKAAEIADRCSLSKWETVEPVLNSFGVGTQFRGSHTKKQGVTVEELWQEIITHRTNPVDSSWVGKLAWVMNGLEALGSQPDCDLQFPCR